MALFKRNRRKIVHLAQLFQISKYARTKIFSPKYFIFVECFSCSVCAEPVSDDGYVERDDLIYCKKCVGSSGITSSNLCEGCGQDIVGVYVNEGGRHYHSKVNKEMCTEICFPTF